MRASSLRCARASAAAAAPRAASWGLPALVLIHGWSESLASWRERASERERRLGFVCSCVSLCASLSSFSRANSLLAASTATATDDALFIRPRGSFVPMVDNRGGAVCLALNWRLLSATFQE